MKPKIMLAVLLLVLSGCASHVPSVQPYFVQSEGAIVSDGFAYDLLYISKDFSLANIYAAGQSVEFSFAGPDSEMLEIGYVFTRKGFDEASYRSRGFSKARIKNATTHHRFQRGIYKDLVAHPKAVPEGTPACGNAVTIVVDGKAYRWPLVVVYTEAWPCDKMDEFGGYHENNLKVAGLRAAGLI